MITANWACTRNTATMAWGGKPHAELFLRLRRLWVMGAAYLGRPGPYEALGGLLCQKLL